MTDVDIIVLDSSEQLHDRIAVADLNATIQSVGFFGTTKQFDCTVVDISRSGLSIKCDLVALKIKQIVLLILSYHDRQFCVKGIVGYRSKKDDKLHFGIIFTEVPYQFDTLIEHWLKISIKNTNSTTESLEPPIALCDTQRRTDIHSYAVNGINLKVMKLNRFGFSKYENCVVIEIRDNGISFISDKIHGGLTDEVKMKIYVDNNLFHAWGEITYCQSTARGQNFGVEFSSSHPNLTHLQNRKKNHTETV